MNSSFNAHVPAFRRQLVSRGVLVSCWMFSAGGYIAEVRAGTVPYVYPYNTMTAAEIVQKLMTPPVTDEDFRERDRAYHYVAGLKDGTQGLVWCFTVPIKPDESTYEVVGAIKEKYPPDALKGNAAPLVLKELKRRYPCGKVEGARQ